MIHVVCVLGTEPGVLRGAAGAPMTTEPPVCLHVDFKASNSHVPYFSLIIPQGRLLRFDLMNVNVWEEQLTHRLTDNSQARKGDFYPWCLRELGTCCLPAHPSVPHPTLHFELYLHSSLL